MDHITFNQKLLEYWTRVGDHEEVAKSIWDITKGAPPAALKAMMNWLKVNAPPGRLLGVKDIYDAKRETGSALKTQEMSSWKVRCDCCGSDYYYKQGHADVCPKCGLSYEDQRDMQEMYDRVDDGTGRWDKYFAEYYRKRKQYCREQLEARKQGQYN